MAKWTISGVAGFIGSNLLETLLKEGHTVAGIDNFLTGRRSNLEDVRSRVASEQWARFRFIEGDIRNLEDCAAACRGADYVLHQAALGSVPRSVADPATSHDVNVNGTVNMLLAARDAGVKRFVYASSSSVYGDDAGLPKREEKTGRALSPYALTKQVGELYASVFAYSYGLQTVGLRYFNVFGPRQDPEGVYAAVIPRWIARMIRGEPCEIYGDGENTRDFSYVENVIEANLLAATTERPEAINQVFNIGCNGRISLNTLFETLRNRLAPEYPHLRDYRPIYREPRSGDVLHSQADVSKAQRLLGFEPRHGFEEGLERSLVWYKRDA